MTSSTTIKSSSVSCGSDIGANSGGLTLRWVSPAVVRRERAALAVRLFDVCLAMFYWPRSLFGFTRQPDYSSSYMVCQAFLRSAAPYAPQDWLSTPVLFFDDPSRLGSLERRPYAKSRVRRAYYLRSGTNLAATARLPAPDPPGRTCSGTDEGYGSFLLGRSKRWSHDGWVGWFGWAPSLARGRYDGDVAAVRPITTAFEGTVGKHQATARARLVASGAARRRAHSRRSRPGSSAASLSIRHTRHAYDADVHCFGACLPRLRARRDRAPCAGAARWPGLIFAHRSR